jgi:NAD(P)-dependent dehydrogenase (short-subunit alcohol dehydrogenase family)
MEYRGKEMKDMVCIVTGSNSGIGKETALALSKIGATVIMLVRNKERGERAQAEIINKTGNHNTVLMLCDLSSMNSIKKFTKEFADNHDKLNVLINNAGAIFRKRQTTVDGFERTLAVNYLGPFLLTYELLSLMKSSVPSRIINLSSGLYKSDKIDFDDLQGEKNYRGMNAYSNVKLMVMMFTYELARRLESTRVTVNAALPGFVATNLGRNSGLLYSLAYIIARPFQISAKKGAETSVYLAYSDEVEGVTGKCFSKQKEIITSKMSNDQQMQKDLWNKTRALLKLT